MTKLDIMNEIKKKEEEKHMHLIDCNMNCNKSTLQSFLNCLNCEDSLLDEYMIVFKLKYPNSAKKILENGNWKLHGFNRYYVYSTAESILA